nr:unnamed protein product [Callosobruchus chinensis]
MFSDECKFHNNLTINRHNFHYYSDSNPHQSIVHNQHRRSLNVWAGIMSQYLISPYFFEGHLNERLFLGFLTNKSSPVLLQDIPLDIRETMIAHFHGEVREFLNDHFQNR